MVPIENHNELRTGYVIKYLIQLSLVNTYQYFVKMHNIIIKNYKQRKTFSNEKVGSIHELEWCKMEGNKVFGK